MDEDHSFHVQSVFLSHRLWIIFKLRIKASSQKLWRNNAHCQKHSMQNILKSTKVKAFKRHQIQILLEINSQSGLSVSSRFELRQLNLPPPRSEQQEQHKAC